MFTNYQETLNFLYTNLPMFQRIGAAALKPDLTNTIALCQALGNPHHKFKSIHVAGTNGKGSTSHMLASILQSAGYQTGLYTSPHLKSFTERIKINGIEIHHEYVVEFVNRIYPQIEELKPSFFEITVALAFDYFANEKVDVAVIEVGLGGRLDSTNVITPAVSVITNIGWDHTDLLGDTLEKIALEKAGIIKNGIPVVISERQPEVANVFEEKASVSGSAISFAADRFEAKTFDANGVVSFDVVENGTMLIRDLSLQLQGSYQKKNLPGVMETVRILNDKGWNIQPESIRRGLEQVVAYTGLKGRWQILGRQPLIVCDTGHNLDGMKEVVRQIQRQDYRTLYFVLGMVKDKDISSVLNLLPGEAYYFFCQAKIPRALDATTLFERADLCGLKGEIVHDVNDALRAAKSKAEPNDMIFIGGSTYVVAEIEDL
jgi:dihydrofolate synthase / folylpolyglutamate synthase